MTAVGTEQEHPQDQSQLVQQRTDAGEEDEDRARMKEVMLPQ